MIKLPINALKGALVCAAQNDSRKFLNGVLIERAANGYTYIVSSAGLHMFIHCDPALECSQAGPWRIIIPRDIIKALKKTVYDYVELSYTGNGDTYQLDNQLFQTLGSTYPEWSRFIPEPPNPGNPMPRLPLSADFVTDCHKALITAMGTSKRTAPYSTVIVDCDNAAIMRHRGTAFTYCVIMPFRPYSLPDMHKPFAYTSKVA
jgi:hypothetical protein